MVDEQEDISQGHSHVARPVFITCVSVEFHGPIEMAHGFDVLVQLNVYITPVRIYAAEPGGVAEGNGHLFGMTKGDECILCTPLFLEQAGYTIVR